MSELFPRNAETGGSLQIIIILANEANLPSLQNIDNTPLGAIGVSLNKQKLMYNILAPSIIAIYKFLCTYGGSVHIYM